MPVCGHACCSTVIAYHSARKHAEERARGERKGRRRDMQANLWRRGKVRLCHIMLSKQLELNLKTFIKCAVKSK